VLNWLEKLGIFLVGVGSFIGSIFRYLLSTWVYRLLDDPWFPYGTLSVNIVGCLAIGFLSALAETRSIFTSDVRLFIFVGILGGFTTFSSFAIETVSLARQTQTLAAVMNIGLGALQLLLGKQKENGEFAPKQPPLWISILSGSVIGLLAGLTGTGGGIFL
jgi:CrcB protein